METLQLNHLYLVTDKETYESIKKSDLISSIAFTYEQKNFADNQIGWEGFYIRGRDTFIEIFYPQNRYPKVGISGIGMGVDKRGALNKISGELMRTQPSFNKGSFKRGGIPWFEYVTINDGNYYENHSFWIMEYASECFIKNAENVSRTHYNAEKYDPKKLFLNVTAFSIALKPKGLSILSSCLNHCSLKARENIYLTSENVEIKIEEESASYKGIYRICFSLREEHEKIITKIGNSILSLDGKVGNWTFFAPELA